MVKPQPDQDAPLPLGPAGAKKLDRDYGAQTGGRLTTAGGVRLPDTDHSLKAGERGPTLLEDFHLREKITHFDHERIPERVVHALGAAGLDPDAPGMVVSDGATAAHRKELIAAMRLHRAWDRAEIIMAPQPS